MRSLVYVIGLSCVCSFVVAIARAEDPGDRVKFEMHRVGTYRGEACGVGDLEVRGTPYITPRSSGELSMVFPELFAPNSRTPCPSNSVELCWCPPNSAPNSPI